MSTNHLKLTSNFISSMPSGKDPRFTSSLKKYPNSSFFSVCGSGYCNVLQYLNVVTPEVIGELVNFKCDLNKPYPPLSANYAVTLDGFVYHDKNNEGFHQGGYEFFKAILKKNTSLVSGSTYLSKSNNFGNDSIRLVTSTSLLSNIRSYSSTTTTDVTAELIKKDLTSNIDYTATIPLNGNIPNTITEKLGKNLHLTTDHPLNLIKKKIQHHFAQQKDGPAFKFYDEFSPRVTSKQNFDELLFPKNHVGRSANDTYYYSRDQLLRTHTSAHQTHLLRDSQRAFLVTGDVYRRDTIDSVHYPIFHQMEGVRTFTPAELAKLAPNSAKLEYNSATNYYEDAEYKNNEEVKLVEAHLKKSLEDMIRDVIGHPDMQIRWINAYFPFTSPSWEMEILFQDKWLEVLGCGVVHPSIMTNCGLIDSRGWAFGLGLERLAMILFEIPDIRLFWTQDSRFHNQFRGVDKNPKELTHIDIKNVKFQSYSKYPSCFKDMTFWLPTEGFHENSYYEFLRSIGGDLIENVEMIDQFKHPKNGKTSQCYRIHYRSMERNLTNEEIDKIQTEIRSKIEKHLNVQLR
ncbi:phenylalanine-tRNA synthetase [Heterostelium album PN500]|uniref:phenylalanine--tRNA ligase n=1 Tax=Heterostelium pallidum (strain ATCC 26659 / Pp 5 / PN500) TaxID=670386 RepID=D3BCN3_HETP5|nr:phenylalanine-tRNA synthetase [Heterostelium album PN500]EFA80675.1 phenylalanine-tRNA synthetase [Heterostelium album PN500]|eukprot:XP_020432795.1 phenylalanine-tRNA synthetase [Heterostelium album PN500]